MIKSFLTILNWIHSNQNESDSNVNQIEIESNGITYYGTENNYIYMVLQINNNVLHWIK